MTATGQPQSPLERRYRRLMAGYPRAFRAIYEEEMISVAMSAAKPGQQRPMLRESAGLIGSGLLMRCRRAARQVVTNVRGDARADGATAYAFIAAVAITALHGFMLAENLAWQSAVDYTPVSRENTALTIGWALVTGALVLRWRRTAAAGAALGVVGQAVAMGRQYDWSPSTFVTRWWELVLVMSATTAAVIAARKQDAEDPMTRRSRIAILVAGALAVLAGPTEAWLAAGDRLPDGAGSSRLQVWLPGHHPMDAIRIVLFATAVTIGLIVVARLAGPARRHAIALAAPVIVTAVGIPQLFSGFLNSSPEFSPAVQLTAGQWVVLILGPVAVLILSAVLVDRHEQRLELIRAAECAHCRLGRPVTG